MRLRRLSACAACAALMLMAGPGAVTGFAQVDTSGIAAGSASASSVFARYSDDATFFEGATLGTADFYLGYASGDVDRSGSSGAIAAVAYSPYVDLPGAVNALTPGPDVDYDSILSRARASITGQPPKDAEASLTTPTDQVEVGTMEAHLAEGPVLDAFTTLTRIEPAPATYIKSSTSRIRVAKISGRSVTEATTILRSVSIAGLITFDSITLTSTATADGGAGDARGTVLVEGGSIAGMPIALTENGIQLTDQAVPLDLQQLEEGLLQAGIELIAPSTLTLEPGPERSVAIATGPKIIFTSPQANRIEIVLGRAMTSSTLLAGFLPPALPSIPPVAPAPFVPAPVDSGGSVFTPPSGVIAQPPAALPGSRVVDLSRLVLSDAKSLDSFAALYGAIAVGGLLVLAGVIAPRRRSLIEERLR
ncbi:MAG: hypothetical protein WEB06_07230 [Actinomycetota bacterium]